MSRNTKEIRNRKSNAKLYPIYKMLSWDLLFYYSIIYLFLVQEKHFSASQVLFGEAFFTASCLILQIPLGILVDKLGKKHSLIFANICMCIFSFTLIIVKTYNQLLLVFFIDAIAYVIKGICETNILYDSLPKGKRRGHLYSTIDGLGLSRYYIIDAITSLIAGFAYVINPNYPIILCLITNIFATILSTRFNHTQEILEEPKAKTSIKKYFKHLKEVTKFCMKSKRMICLLMFFGLISGLIYSMTTFRSSVLQEINIPAQYFGIILAISQIVAAMFSRAQNIIHRTLRNKTLSYLGIPFTVSCMIIGFLGMIKINFTVIFLIIFLFVVQGAIKGSYNVLIYRYLNNFTNRQVRIKLATIRNMIYNFFTVIITLLGALLLKVTDATSTMLIIGCISTITIILLLDYMRDKVGLKPEEYKPEDLKYSTIVKK
jgi:MFS family permease